MGLHDRAEKLKKLGFAPSKLRNQDPEDGPWQTWRDPVEPQCLHLALDSWDHEGRQPEMFRLTGVDFDAVMESIGRQFTSIALHGEGFWWDRDLFQLVFKRLFPHIDRVCIEAVGWEDKHLSLLVAYLPRRLTMFTLRDLVEESPRFFKKIKEVLPHLLEFKLEGFESRHPSDSRDGGFVHEVFDSLVDLINNLHSLESLHFDDVWVGSKNRWEPVIQALQGHPSLKNVSFGRLRIGLAGRPLEFDQKWEDLVLYRLGVNRADAVLSSPPHPQDDKTTLKQWMEVLVASRHQTNVVHYLLSAPNIIDPSLYVRQGEPSRKRRVEALSAEASDLAETSEQQLGRAKRARVFKYRSM